MDDNQPVTRQELKEELQTTKRELQEELQALGARFDAKLEHLLERTQEMIRDSQTEVLRGFERYAYGNEIRLRKMETGLSTLDESSTRRLAMLEERILEVEKKLLLRGGH